MSDQQLCNTITSKINEIVDLINRFQLQTGTLNDEIWQQTIFGRLKKLESSTDGGGTGGTTGSSLMRLEVERELGIYDNGKFNIQYEPIGGVCVDDRVHINMGDGTEEIYTGITFNNLVGQLVGVGDLYDGKTLTVSYVCSNAQEDSESGFVRMAVETNVAIFDSGKFFVKYKPIGGVCVNDRVHINLYDGTEDIYENVVFSELNGFLVGAGDTFDGKTLTISYLYISKYLYEYIDFIDADEELVINTGDYLGECYKIIVDIKPLSPTVPVYLKWVNTAYPDQEINEVITGLHIREIHEADFFYRLYLSGSANVTIKKFYKVL